MSNICLYFQIHQPWRLKNYSIFNIGTGGDYFETDEKTNFDNRKVMNKVADKSYRPMMNLLLKKLESNPDFKFALSITGVAIEQMQNFAPDLVELLQKMAETGRVEFLSETYYHSLSSLYSTPEFFQQVRKHFKLMEQLFGQSPKVFRNTELVYTNRVAEIVSQMGYKGMLAEGAGKILRGRRPTHVYAAPCGLPLLLKHYQLSDDIAFRFSESARSEKPLTADTYSHWISSSFSPEEIVNLFMDFETFGEHQWEDTGIFNFFDRFVDKFVETGNNFLLPMEALKMNRPVDIFDSSDPVSWADVDRDITAWRGNELQYDSLAVIYELEKGVMKSNDEKLIDDWRKLQTSDHYYYMCTKWSNDGDVHAYFSPYGSPYNAYVNFNNAISDLKWRLLAVNKNG